jgi:hypothetical protein
MVERDEIMKGNGKSFNSFYPAVHQPFKAEKKN